MVDDKARPLESGTLARSRKQRRCYGLMCCLGTLLLIIVLVIILIFTVFKVKDPIMVLNKITLNTANVARPDFRPGSNLSMTADASVTNPNVGTFKFSNSSTSIFYKGVMVGQGNGPPGQARAHRTLRMNTTLELVVARVLTVPNLSEDLMLGLFSMDSYTRVPGKVKVLFVAKEIVVEMNCTVGFNITSQEIQDQRCKSHVEF